MASLGIWSCILLVAFCVTAVSSLPADRSVDLLTLDSLVSTLDVAACDEDDVISCISAYINPAAIDSKQIMVEGVMLTKVQEHLDQANDGSISAEFSSPDGSTAVFTVRGNYMFGAVEFTDGSVYLLENCGEHCHVWMELDTDLEDDGDDQFEISEDDTDMIDMSRDSWYTALQTQGKNDLSTIVEFSIMIYYTPEFAATTPDVQTYVDQVIAETNQGYINSLIPIRIKLHCLELAGDLHDIYDSSDMISAFKSWGGSDIRRSADAAALLVDDSDYCGRGYIAGYLNSSPLTITVSKKSCALGYFTFGHELGHNMGTTHDKEHGTNKNFAYGFGKHIGPKYLGGGRGWRTIMAYNAAGYAHRANFYSNPNVQFMGHDTGSDEEDSARVIRENRFVIAALGDEDESCAAPTSAPPTTEAPIVSTEAPTPTSTSSSMNNGCSCSDFINFNGLGQCKKKLGGSVMCYVNLPSTCTDRVESKSNPGMWWSHEACEKKSECVDGFFVKGRNVKKAQKADDGYKCQQRCLNTDGCEYFSYYMPEFKQTKKAGKCFLMKNKKKMIKRKDVFSGPKTCYTM